MILFVGSEWYYTLCSVYFKCNAQIPDNPWQRGKNYQLSQKNVFCRQCKQIWKTKVGKDDIMTVWHVNTVASSDGKNPTKGNRRLSAQMGINQSSVIGTLRVSLGPLKIDCVKIDCVCVLQKIRNVNDHKRRIRLACKK